MKKKVKIFSALEVAGVCGVVNQTAINWIKNGYLKAFTTPGGQYRTYAENLVEFLESRGMKIPSDLQYLSKESNKKCLLIYLEDSLFLKSLHEKIKLDCSEYQIILALSPFEAGILVARKKPDFVILSGNMDGIAAENLRDIFPHNCEENEVGNNKQKIIVVKEEDSSSFSFAADLTVDCFLDAGISINKIVSFVNSFDK